MGLFLVFYLVTLVVIMIREEFVGQKVACQCGHVIGHCEKDQYPLNVPVMP